MLSQSTLTRFSELMRAGNLALASGDRHRAHALWRRAATLQPDDEQVWLALLSVVDDEADRRVCLKNIIAINPNNVQARQQLEGYNTLLSILNGGQAGDTEPVSAVARGRSRRRALVWWLEGLIIGVLLAVAIAIVRIAFL